MHSTKNLLTLRKIIPACGALPCYIRRVNTPETLMRRCFRLARFGLGSTWPNPLVGAVVVSGNEIIGEGFHRRAGAPHAEVEAIRSVADPSRLHGSTVYVNLEPCSHHGRTPPCADLLIASGVARVVISNSDPFPQVSGQGIARLREAGIEVVTGVLEDEGNALNRRFFTFWKAHRPYVVLKWAVSADGYIDKLRQPGETGSHPISGFASARLVHRWRSEEQAILVGPGTALTDDPELTVRHVEGPSPLRAVIDPRRNLPDSLRMFCGDSPAMRLHGESPGEWLRELHAAGIQSVLVEGGRATLQAFLDTGLWDEARVIHAPVTLRGGLTQPVLHTPASSQMTCGGDTITYHFHS
jgi:diaminohydroxyphosphoribosylaminopyrimidine deaminase / 5-amino-6-(5-phosphoribosylamino)uracil reductase